MEVVRPSSAINSNPAIEPSSAITSSSMIKPDAPPVFDFADRPDYSSFVQAAGTGRRQPLAGFDADYTDIVDYIVRCTHKIWEEKAVGLIYTVTRLLSVPGWAVNWL